MSFILNGLKTAIKIWYTTWIDLIGYHLKWNLFNIFQINANWTSSFRIFIICPSLESYSLLTIGIASTPLTPITPFTNCGAFVVCVTGPLSIIIIFVPRTSATIFYAINRPTSISVLDRFWLTVNVTWLRTRSPGLPSTPMRTSFWIIKIINFQPTLWE